MAKHFIGLIFLALLGCSQPPKPILQLSDLKVPNPEADALHRQGIRHVIAMQDSKSVDGLSNAKFRPYYHLMYDSLGRMVLDWDRQSSWSLGNSTRYVYKSNGWADSIIYHSDFSQREKLSYLYMPSWRILMQSSCCVYSSPHSFWTFDRKGYATSYKNANATVYYDYDTLQRLASEVTVANNESPGYLRDAAAAAKTYFYVNNDTASPLKLITEIHFDRDTNRLKKSSVKYFDNKGLPTEQLFDDGTRLYFLCSDSLYNNQD